MECIGKIQGEATTTMTGQQETSCQRIIQDLGRYSKEGAQKEENSWKYLLLWSARKTDRPMNVLNSTPHLAHEGRVQLAAIHGFVPPDLSFNRKLIAQRACYLHFTHMRFHGMLLSNILNTLPLLLASPLYRSSFWIVSSPTARY